jgi:hypothetical protein
MQEAVIPARVSAPSYQWRRNDPRVRRVEMKMHIVIAMENNELKKNAAGAGGK